ISPFSPPAALVASHDRQTAVIANHRIGTERSPLLGCARLGVLRVCGESLMGDFEEVERLQAGIRAWLLRTARSGRHDLRGIDGPAVLPLLCAAAFGPVLADADGAAPGLAKMGVLTSVGADVLAHRLAEASSRARSAAADVPD